MLPPYIYIYIIWNGSLHRLQKKTASKQIRDHDSVCKETVRIVAEVTLPSVFMAHKCAHRENSVRKK
jgi:hypothetical protein